MSALLLIVPVTLLAAYAIVNRNRRLGQSLRHPPSWVHLVVIGGGLALIYFAWWRAQP